MVKISIIYITARVDCPMTSLPGVHQFTLFLDSLKTQTFKDFEVIISDLWYNERNRQNKYDFSRYPFVVKYVNPCEFSWAKKKGLLCFSDNYNMGVIHADGELLLWFNDCCKLVNENSLQLWWDWYQKGYFASALVHYYKGKYPLCQDGITPIVDSRYPYVNNTPDGIYYFPGSQYYGYSSSTLEATLRANGYDSNFDGQKALNDVEFGMRLERLGYKFVCDKNLWLIETIHIEYPKEIMDENPQPFRSNLGLIILHQKNNKNTGNDYKLSTSDLAHVIRQGEELGIRVLPGSFEYKVLIDWFNNSPMYNLRELRNERLRKERKL